MNLGGGRGAAGSMSLPGSGQTRKTGPAESDEFPAGLRVLVVDDDPTCLKILERMLVTCRYDVTKCSRVDYALNELRNNKNGFDVVISDVHMPNIDGFKLLEYVGLEMDLPVIMMSADDSKNVVMKGVKHGACDYLTKPIRMEALKNIWQHVVRKKKNEWPEVEPLDKKGQRHDANEENWKSSKRKGDDEEADDKDDYGGFKKQRVVWSVELHQQFVAAVNQLGVDKAVPKKILELMDVPGLTRENVASHLQKYRLCLRKLIGEPHHLGGMANSYMSVPNAAFGSMASLGGIDLQTLTAYQPSLPGLPHINPGLSMPLRQTNAFGYESSSISRLSELQHLQQLNKSDQQSYLLHGNSTAMEPRRLTSFYQSAESLETILQQPLLSTGELAGALPRNVLADNIQGMPYTLGNNFPELSGLIQEDANLAKKRSRGFGTEYDMFNELSQQQKPQAWLYASSSLGGIQHKSSCDNINAATTSDLGNQNQGYIRNSINGNKNVFSTGPVAQEGLNIQSGNNLADENVSSGMKPAEAVQEASSTSNHYHFEFEQDDLLSIMLKQQEQVTGASEGEFDFAALDDIF